MAGFIWTSVFRVCYIGSMTLIELIPVLQMAIGPVVLISGVGLLILSLTNRLGRVVDRGRILKHELRESQVADNSRIVKQINILSRRARLLQRAIEFAVVCLLFAAILIITLFFTALMEIELAWLVGGLFAAAMVSLIISLVSFLYELNQALVAFNLEIKG
jgi:hypothetical protein